MKKKWDLDIGGSHWKVRKFFLTMKIIVCIFFLGLTTVSARSFSQVRFSMKVEQAPLSEVFREITRLTGYEFMYSNDELRQAALVSVKVEEEALDKVLEQCLEGTNLWYIIEDKVIVISPKLSPPQKTQETRVVSGTVRNAKGELLPGVTVILKGTAMGTATDINGQFKLTLPQEAQTLSFSYVGMISQEITLQAGQSVCEVVLKEDNLEINEVVVIGYGTALKKDLTGAVSSMTGKTVANLPITNTATALTGRLAGVQVTTNDGAPDSEIQIRVRGGGSITQDNNPLFIVDGFPVERISDIAPSDIETIDVLKDASSTAIYGARGANGVVIVTTKAATAGRIKVSYNAYAQLKKAPKKFDVLNSYEFVKLQHELLHIKYAGEVEDFLANFGDVEDFDIYKNIPGRDSQEQMYGRNAYGQSHNISINGGTEKTKMAASLTYVNEDGVLLNSAFRRLNANFKLSQKLYEHLKLDLSAYYTNSVINGAGTSANTSTEIKNVVSFRPVTGKSGVGDINIDAENDDIVSQSELYDPLLLIDQDYKKQKREELNINAALTWDVWRGITYKAEFGILSSDRRTDRFYGPLTYTARSNAGKPVAEIRMQERPRWRTAHTLNYKLKNFKNKHDFGVLLGFEAMSESVSSITNTSRMFPEDISPKDALSRMQFGSPEYTVTDQEPDNRLASFFGRLNYTFLKRYLFTFTLRADGSTKFAPDNRWGIFPSGAIAWRISGEPFMRNLHFLDDMKLRVSYGEAGNNRIANDMWRRTYTGTISSPVVGIGNVPNLYYKNTSSTLINPELTWETTISRNVGLDFSMFDGRLSGTVEGYWNTTKDLLLKSIIPQQTGYNDQQQNIGQTSNRGFEFTLSGRLIETKDFTLSASLNFSLNRNKVDKLANVETTFYRSGWASGLKESDDYILQVGKSLGLMYGYVTDGFYTVDDFLIDEAGKWTLKPGIANSQPITDSHQTVNQAAGMPAPGSLKLKKTTPYNPDDPASCVVTPEDRRVIGNATPKHSGGLTISAVYKNIDLSLFFNWVYGNSIYNANKILFTTQWKKNYYNMLTAMDSEHRFRYMNDAGERITDPGELKTLNEHATIWSPAMKVPVFHSWAVEDGSFLRLNNITLGYSLPQHWISKIHMSQCRFYCTVNNVFVWTKYSGFDPEVNTRTETPLTPGVDYSSYPKARVFTLGANITF